jgi:hypothetical protein
MIQRDLIAQYHSLRPIRFPILRSFEILQEMGQGASLLRLSLDLISNVPGEGTLLLTFDRVVDLKVDWPQWSLVRVDVIEIADVSDRRLEDIRYRVSEGTGFFAFSCGDFHAAVE